MNGKLKVEVSCDLEALPVAGADVAIYSWRTGKSVTLSTDEDGRTEIVPIDTPDIAPTLEPGDDGMAAWSRVNITVTKSGFLPAVIDGVQVYDDVMTIVPVTLYASSEELIESTEIPVPAILSDIQSSDEGGTVNSRVLNDVYIPEYVTVHLGTPSSYARNVVVSFPNYIKNVASSEIYPTWPANALRANIYAIIGFTLNRFYTEWYRSRGYSFDITSSTAYDQAFVEGRNFFDSISVIVDEVFSTYPRRKGQLQPLFTQYCNGTTVTCGVLSQWGTVSLSNNGYSPLGILRYYYGSDVELVTTSNIKGYESSYPGIALRSGSRGSSVKTIQRQLARIAKNYPSIGALTADGIFGAATEAAVRRFQTIFDLTSDGIVGRATWNKISYIYVAVKGLAELDGEGEYPYGIVPYPGYLIRRGQSGENVRIMQQYLSDIAKVYGSVPKITVDGVFGSGTETAVKAFQRYFGLTADGIVGKVTWNRLTDVWQSL